MKGFSAVQDFAWAARRRRENAITFRNAGPLLLVICSLADQARITVRIIRARARKARLKKARKTRSSQI
jgi:hypothetical protein